MGAFKLVSDFAPAGDQPAATAKLAEGVLRGDDRQERLGSTSTPLGLFKQWDCSIGECNLLPGDVLALYTDGVSEACNDAGEEFGERYLTERLRQHREMPCQALLTAISDEVRQFQLSRTAR